MGATSGDTVRVHYRGTLDDGSEFDSSAGREPLEFTVGAGQVIRGFDAAVTGLEPGDSVTVTVPVDEAYGQHNPDWQVRVPTERVSRFDEGGVRSAPEVGDQVTVMTPQGPSRATVAAIEADETVLDFNHPLAGKALTFEIELVEIVGG
ncbi:MAG: peptidylprolyl isomerase [Actinobacteria bacterium]|nr:MAG: peptidylprolyl isomerase [Actinomycetota bacterium]